MTGRRRRVSDAELLAALEGAESVTAAAGAVGVCRASLYYRASASAEVAAALAALRGRSGAQRERVRRRQKAARLGALTPAQRGGQARQAETMNRRARGEDVRLAHSWERHGKQGKGRGLAEWSYRWDSGGRQRAARTPEDRARFLRVMTGAGVAAIAAATGLSDAETRRALGLPERR